MIQYINIDQASDILSEIYRNERDSNILNEKDDIRDFILSEFDNDTIEDLAHATAESLNKDMKEYLNSSDHNLLWYGANIDRDYTRHRTGKSISYGNLVDDLTARLNSDDDSNLTEDDRNWLTDWIFENLGTFGFRYNFGSYIADSIDCYEKENVQ